MANRADSIVCIKDFELEARCNLPKKAYEYFSRGTGEEQTLHDNELAYKRLRLRPRLMRDVSQRDLSTSILGHHIPFPIAISPTSMHRMAHRDGEKATAKAAAALGAGMTLSSWSSTSMEDVTKAAPTGLRWLQITPIKDRKLLRNFVKRAENSGYKALFLTVDRPVISTGPYNQHGKLVMDYSYENLRGSGLDDSKTGSSVLSLLKDSSATWDIVRWLRSITSLPVVAKGILTAEDAREAVKHGVSGILVSNHGGRALDGVPATIDVLPEIVEAVEDSGVEIYVDGGVRMGTDVLKALALGARAVFVGRPVLWGLAHDGENGVKRVLEILRDELSLGMALAGCRSICEITPDLIERTHTYVSKL